MDSGLQLLKLQAASLLQSCEQLRLRLGTVGTPAGTAFEVLIADTRRNAAISLGALASDYLLGTTRPGAKLARTLVDEGRKHRRRKSHETRNAEAQNIVRSARSLVGQLEDPIDWRLRRHLETILTRAESAATWKSAISKTEGALREILVYSPPTDPISLVRVLDRKFRFVIRERLSRVGPNWWEERIRRDIRTRAGREALARGKPANQAVDFLTFNDYRVIIIEPVNWTDSFGPLFGDKATFEDRFSTLKRIRNDIAHSRLISGTDREVLSTITAALFPQA